MGGDRSCRLCSTELSQDFGARARGSPHTAAGARPPARPPRPTAAPAPPPCRPACPPVPSPRLEHRQCPDTSRRHGPAPSSPAASLASPAPDLARSLPLRLNAGAGRPGLARAATSVDWIADTGVDGSLTGAEVAGLVCDGALLHVEEISEHGCGLMRAPTVAMIMIAIRMPTDPCSTSGLMTSRVPSWATTIAGVLKEECGLPFACVVQPFHALDEKLDRPEIVRAEEIGRCSACFS